MTTETRKGIPVVGRLVDAFRHRPIVTIALWALLVPLLSVSYLLYRAPRLPGDEAEIVWPFFLLGSLNTFAGLLSLLALVTIEEDRERRGKELDHLRDRDREAQSTVRRLEDELQLLSAMREMSHLLNDDVRFEGIWEKVLEILDTLVVCDEVAVFLREGDEDGPLVPKVHHKGGVNRFAADIDASALDDGGVREALEHRSVYQVVEHDLLLLFFPLAVDGENIGVLKVTVPLTGDAMARVERIEDCQAVLTDLLKHLSLAIKTPTLYEVAVLDQLTGLYTKRFFVQQIGQQLRVARRHGTPFTLIIMDIDKFKSVNDNYGHLTGDIILRGVAEVVQESARETDTCYRYGGEEMCVLLPSTDLGEASILAERIRATIEESTFRGAQGEELRVTSSFGIAQFDDAIVEFTDLVERADQCLYRAKDGGRNQVWKWSGKEPVANRQPPASRPARKPRALTRRKGGKRQSASL